MNKLTTFASEIVSRALLMSRLGQQYGGERDIYTVLGYPLEIDYDDSVARWKRQDMAKAIINKPVNATWRGGFTVTEDGETDTAFAQAIQDLQKQFKLHSVFARLDKLTGLGKYGILLMGFNDVTSKEMFEQPVQQGQRELLYIKPYGQGNVDIYKYEDDTSNPRFGLPKIYQISAKNPGTNTTEILLVHHSRVVHVVDELMENEYKGQPRLAAGFNRLMDLEKLVGGSAEMFWRGARPGYQGKLDKDYQFTTEDKEALEAQMDEYEHSLRRLLINEGVDLEQLQTQVADPKNHVDVQIQMLSAAYGIPKRILTGSERGELASSDDKNQWNTLIKSRREEYAVPCILNPFFDKCVEYGVLPYVEEYNIEWEDLFAPSQKEKAEIGKTRAESLSNYTRQPAAMTVVPPEQFFKHFLGLERGQIEAITEAQERAIDEEEIEIRESQEDDV